MSGAGDTSNSCGWPGSLRLAAVGVAAVALAAVLVVPTTSVAAASIHSGVAVEIGQVPRLAAVTQVPAWSSDLVATRSGNVGPNVAVPVQKSSATSMLWRVSPVPGSFVGWVTCLLAPVVLAVVASLQSPRPRDLLQPLAFMGATGEEAGASTRLVREAAAEPYPTEEADFAMAAAASAKTKKGTKAKGKAGEKPEKVRVELTPEQVQLKMRKAVLRLNKKHTKTTGRVCMLLHKVDNRQARAISFSHRRTRRVQHINLHWRRLWWEEGKSFVRLRLSTKGIKTITRYGLHQAAIKFGLDLTRHLNGVSARKYTQYLPEQDKKLALLRDPELRYKNAVRWAKLNDLEVPVPPQLPKKGKTAAKAEASAEAEPQVIAMAISHGQRVPELNKSHSERKALFRSLTTELIRHGRIKTTYHRAKAIRKSVDHMITLAKQGSLHDRRQALAYIYDKNLVKTLFEQVPERYASRAGGYTRIIRTMPRKGDCAEMCYIELL